MAKKVNFGGRNITIRLTLIEYEVFKDLCMEFLGTYKLALSRKRAMVLNKILDKLEEARK